MGISVILQARYRGDIVTDDSAFSRARKERFRAGDIFRRLFERIIQPQPRRPKS